jgi:hypothetical protein
MTATLHKIVWDDTYIATSQRMLIETRSWSTRVLYRWWGWWIPRIVIVGILGWLIATGVKLDSMSYAYFVGALILNFFGELWIHRSLVRARGRHRNRGSTTTVTMSEDGIDTIHALGDSHLKWKAPRSIRVKQDGILLMVSSLAGLWLPDAALTEGTPAEVRQLVAAKAGGQVG